MSRFNKDTVKRVGIVLGIFLFIYVAVKQCDTSIAVGKNAVIIPGECVVINYDATVKDWDEAKAAWIKARGLYPAKGTGHTNIYR